MGVTTTIAAAISSTIYTDVLDGAVYASGIIFLDSGLPVRVAVAAALPAPNSDDWIPMGSQNVNSLGLVLDAADNVYVMAIVGQASTKIRVLRTAR